MRAIPLHTLLVLLVLATTRTIATAQATTPTTSAPVPAPTPPTAAPTSKCTPADDLLWERSEYGKAEDMLEFCGKEGFGTYQASLECFMEESLLSDTCLECFAALVECTRLQCSVCVSGRSDECDSCADTKCNPGFIACSGYNPTSCAECSTRSPTMQPTKSLLPGVPNEGSYAIFAVAGLTVLGCVGSVVWCRIRQQQEENLQSVHSATAASSFRSKPSQQPSMSSMYASGSASSLVASSTPSMYSAQVAAPAMPPPQTEYQAKYQAQLQAQAQSYPQMQAFAQGGAPTHNATASNNIMDDI